MSIRCHIPHERENEKAIEEKLWQYARNTGSKGLDNVEIHYFPESEGGRGLRCCRYIPGGSCVLKIANEIIITPSKVEAHPTFGPFIRHTLSKLGASDSSLNGLQTGKNRESGNLLKQDQNYKNVLKLALYVVSTMKRSPGYDKNHYLYFQSFPLEIQGDYKYWLKHEADDSLASDTEFTSGAYHQTQEAEGLSEEDHFELREQLKGEDLETSPSKWNSSDGQAKQLRQLFGYIAEQEFSLCVQHDTTDCSVVHATELFDSFEDFIWAFSCVVSRSMTFVVPNSGDESTEDQTTWHSSIEKVASKKETCLFTALVPIADMLNHKHSPQNLQYHLFATSDECVYIYARYEYLPGEQVTINYGQNLPNSKLHYGFNL